MVLPSQSQDQNPLVIALYAPYGGPIMVFSVSVTATPWGNFPQDV